MSTITTRSIADNRREAQAAWYEREADELRASGDADLWNLAADYDQRAAELRGME